jgi:hypothetical protein
VRPHIKSYVIDLRALGKAYSTKLTEKSALRQFLSTLFPVASDTALMRLGPNGDGGYLLPDDLEGIEACFSPGVNQVCGFEKDCADRGMKVFLADHSVDKPPHSHPLFHFSKKYVGVTSNDTFMTVDDWVSSSLPNSGTDLLLQIDIEGFEYETFLAMSDALLRRFRIIVAEFHNLDQFWSRPFFSLASRAFEKILQSHRCVHIHPNNCCRLVRCQGLYIPRVAEFTFLRKDRVRNPSFARTFPHPLDFDNTGNAPLPLPACWYGAA